MKRHDIWSIIGIMLCLGISPAMAQYHWTTLAGMKGESGSTDGIGSAARFGGPSGIVVDGSGIVYVADTGNFTVRKITSDGVVTTLAGKASFPGSADGTGGSARFDSPRGVAVDESGNVYVADTGNDTIRKIASGGVVTTLAGKAGIPGNADGGGSAARFSSPAGIAVDASGNIYVADTGNHTIRKISSGGVVSTLAGSAGNYGSVDGTGNAARFWGPEGIAADAIGNVYVADTDNDTIRKITNEGTVTTLAGSNGQFYYPAGVATDGLGNVYVADTEHCWIRKISNAGKVSTISPNFTNANGEGESYPVGVAVDGSGNVFVAETGNNCISHGVYRGPEPPPPVVKVTLKDLTTDGTFLNGTIYGTVTTGAALANFSVFLDFGLGTYEEINGVDLNGSRLGSSTPNGVVSSTPNVGANMKADWAVYVDRFENGPNRLTVQAVDKDGKSATAAAVINCVNYRPELAGTYSATLMPPMGYVGTNCGIGMVTVTVTAAGIFTGKIQIGGTRHSFSGILHNDGTAWFNNPDKYPNADLIEKYFDLQFRVDATAGIQGEVFVSDDLPGDEWLSEFEGPPAGYSAKNPVPGTLLNQPVANPTKGYYTVSFPSKTQTPAKLTITYPQGNGYAAMTLAKTGAIRLAGVLADGTKFTATGALRADGAASFFTLLYAKQGGFGGDLTFDSTANDTDVTGMNLLWLRPDKSAVKVSPKAYANAYAAGWPSGIRVDAIGMKYAKPASLNFGQNYVNGSNGNASLAFTGGLFASPVNVPVGINPMTGVVSPKGVLNLNTTTGIFSGILDRTDRFGGVLLNKGSNRGGNGYFLSSPTSVSGRVLLNPMGS